jgi:mono/diheme cytochrome c family protein
VPVNAPEYVYHPDPNEYQVSAIEDPPLDPLHPDRFIQPRIGVPLHAHWINYDPTDAPPPWVPRRDVWEDVIVNGHPDTALPVGTKSPEQLEAAGDPTSLAAAAKFRQDRAIMPPALEAAQLTDALRAYATTDRPFALWQTKPGCESKLASQKTVAQIGSDQRPDWFAVAKPDATAPVYMMAPGAFVFRHVCINCHGPNADGKGIQVDLLSAASEGEARPANFRSGLFGPPEMPLANLIATFDIGGHGDKVAADQWASRYMAWMALGGTLKRIPQDILHLVAATPIFGQKRNNIDELPGATDPTGNMLNLAKGLCSIVLPAPTSSLHPELFDAHLFAFDAASTIDATWYPPYNHDGSPFITTTYDREMWVHLCSDYSPQIVRVYGALIASAGDQQEIRVRQMYYAIDPADDQTNPRADNPANFPADQPVWDQNKMPQQGVKRQNLYPACLDPFGITADKIARLGMPVCPPTFLQKAKPLWRWVDPARFPTDSQSAFSDNVQSWKLRGGIAAGMAVFSYLERRIPDATMTNLPPYFDQCEQLP